MTKKFENFQKKCIKWILSEEEFSYSGNDHMYIRKCRQVDILPMVQRSALNDLIFFHKIVYGLVPVNIPDYLSWFEGTSRLRSSHLDRKSLVCTLLPRTSSSRPLEKSLVYRTHTSWNILPLELREISSTTLFRIKLENHLWESILGETDTCGNESI